MQWEEPVFYEVHLDADMGASYEESHETHDAEFGAYSELDLDASSLAHALA
jgi:hypothetical protein